MSNCGFGFTKVPNSLIYATNLSCEAKFVYILLISRQNMPNWRWGKSALMKYAGFGRDKLAKVLKELICTGVIVKENSKNNGRFSYVYYLPLTENQLTVKQQHINKENKNNKEIVNNIVNDLAKKLSSCTKYNKV